MTRRQQCWIPGKCSPGWRDLLRVWCYGYRRVGAALRHQGVVVNGKKLRRLMREHDLQPKRRRCYVVTTDSDHASPIFPDLAEAIVPDGPTDCGWPT